MKIEEAIQQRKPMIPLQKAMVNLIFTYNRIMDANNAVFKPFQVTAQQYNVLRILKGRHPEPVSVGDVKSVMLDKSPDLTRLCDRLVDKQLIERATNCNNRREVLIQITQKGLGLLDQIEPATTTCMMFSKTPIPTGIPGMPINGLANDKTTKTKEMIPKMRNGLLVKRLSNAKTRPATMDGIMDDMITGNKVIGCIPSADGVPTV